MIREPRGAIFGRHGQRHLRQPPLEEPLDVRRTQAVTERLQGSRVGRVEEAVVQRGKAPPPSLRLALGPFVPVQTQLQRVGRVATDLDEGRPPLAVDHIDVVVVDVHRGPLPREMHPRPPLGLAGRPRPRAFLRHAHEHDARHRCEAVPIFLNQIIFPFALPELDPRNPSGVAPGPQPRPERRRDLAKHRRRGNDRAPGLAQKSHHPALALQSRHVAVEVQPVYALHVQRHVLSDNLSHVGHRSLPGSATRRVTIPTASEGSPRAPSDVLLLSTGRFEAKLR